MADEQPVVKDFDAANEKDGDAAAIHSKATLPTWTWVLTLIGIYLGALLYGLDTTIAADIQGPIYATFGEIEKLPWVGLGFPMASVAVILLTGRLYELFNVKWLILTYIALFEIGSAVCGAAPNLDSLIVGRVIAGVGGAGMYLGALTYISIYSSLQMLPVYNALIGLSWGTGAILGPVVGGAFSQSNATWRWAFYINLPLAGLLAPVYLFINPSYNPKPQVFAMEKIKSLDWVGSFLNAGVFTIFMVVVSFSGSLWQWDSAQSIALWIIYGLFQTAFVIQQSFLTFTTPDRRIFPVHFLKSKTLVLLYIGTACAAAGTSVTLYYVPLFFQFTRGDDALKAAIRLLPFICVNIFAIMFAGALLPRFGRYAPWYLAGGLFMTAGSAAMFTIQFNTPTRNIYAFEALIGLGTGLSFQSAYAVATAKVHPRDRSNAIGFINVAQIGTVAISLAIAACLFQNLGYADLQSAFGQSSDFSASDIRSALAGTESRILRGAGEQVAMLAISSVAHTISQLFGMVVASGSLLTVASFLMRWERLELTPTAGG